MLGSQCCMCKAAGTLVAVQTQRNMHLPLQIIPPFPLSSPGGAAPRPTHLHARLQVALLHPVPQLLH